MNTPNIAIIGGGLSALATGFYLKQRFDDELKLTIFEKDSRPGGTVGVFRESGYIVDWGPNGFLDREPIVLELVDQIGLTEKLLKSNEKAEKRFIYRNGKLREIAMNPLKFMTSSLLSPLGRLRLVMEPFIKAKNSDEDETIFDFAARRIGKEAATYMIDPMCSGIFGGDARKLSLAACFPKMVEFETKYGGLIKAMMKLKKTKKNVSAGGPSGKLTSFTGGLYTLIEKFQQILGDSIRTSNEIESITRCDNGKFILEPDASNTQYDVLIPACPSYVIGDLLKDVQPKAAQLLAEIDYCGIAVVCQGYDRCNVPDSVDGFGFLVPRNQNRKILGSIWTSMIFPDQAPADKVLLRTMVDIPKGQKLPDEQYGQIVHEELSDIMGLSGQPQYQKIICWEKAIPQYHLNHLGRINNIENLLNPLNIRLVGNAYSGVGINDVVKRAQKIAGLI